MQGPSGARRRTRIRVKALAVAVALGCAAAAAGCGLGAGEGSRGEAALTVTRDYGAADVVESTIGDPAETDTVIRVLDREAEIATRYGGGFVQSIDGIAGDTEDGRSRDWFFYVNGIESPVGAAEAHVEAGDRIWWDHHDWTDVMRVPAVVGSFPQPFEAAAAEDGRPIEVGCAGEERVCEAARAALEDEGVEAETVAAGEALPGDRPRLLVGELEALADDPAASLLLRGPELSGVFARFTAQGAELELLDERAGSERSGQFGLIAATARGAEAPTWVVTGTDPASVAEASELLGGALLHNRFAVAVGSDGETIPLPVR
jgi:hypothetical protein